MASSPALLSRFRRAQPAADRPPLRPWHWLLALVPGFFLRTVLLAGLMNIDQVVGLAVAGGLFLWFLRRPELVPQALLVVLPFQLLLTAALYALGVDGGAVRMIGLWKEVAAAALVAAAWQVAARARHRLDVLDRLCVAYVALGTAFLVAQPLLVGGAGGGVSLDGRFVSWRSTVFPVLLLLAARHLRMSGVQLRRLIRTTVGVGIAFGVVGLVELFASDAWNSFVVDTLGVNRFRTEVLDVPLGALAGGYDDIRVYGLVGGQEIVRMGGPMVGQLTFSFLLLVLLAVVLEQSVRTDRPPRVPLAAGLMAFSLVLTQTRSSILGAAVVMFFVLRPRPGRDDVSRRRLAIVAGSLLLAVLPFAVSGGLADRFIEGDRASDRDHSQSLDRALDAVQSDPLGRGLGMGALAGSSFEPGAIVPENQLLDVGVQLGVVGMGLFAAVVGALIVRLGRAAGDGGTGAALGARSALLGLLVPCWFLQPLITPEVGWVLFVLAGAALGSAEREHAATQRDRASERLLAH